MNGAASHCFARERCGLAVVHSFPKPMVVVMMAKGPWSQGPRAPSFSCNSCAIQYATKTRPKPKIKNQKAKPRGVFGCECRLVYPHPTFPFSHSLKILRSSKRLMEREWHQSSWQSNQKRYERKWTMFNSCGPISMRQNQKRSETIKD